MTNDKKTGEGAACCGTEKSGCRCREVFLSLLVGFLFGAITGFATKDMVVKYYFSILSPADVVREIDIDVKRPTAVAPAAVTTDPAAPKDGEKTGDEKKEAETKKDEEKAAETPADPAPAPAPAE